MKYNKSITIKLILSISILSILLAIVIQIGKYPYYIRDDGYILGILDTKHRLKEPADFIQLFASDSKKKQLPKNMKELLGYLYKKGMGIEELYDRRSWLDPNTKELVDAWKNPIHLEVKSDNEYIFISSGRNGKYENGQGDDIIYSFNPYESRKEKESANEHKN